MVTGKEIAATLFQLQLIVVNFIPLVIWTTTPCFLHWEELSTLTISYPVMLIEASYIWLVSQVSEILRISILFLYLISRKLIWFSLLVIQFKFTYYIEKATEWELRVSRHAGTYKFDGDVRLSSPLGVSLVGGKALAPKVRMGKPCCFGGYIGGKAVAHAARSGKSCWFGVYPADISCLGKFSKVK